MNVPDCRQKRTAHRSPERHIWRAAAYASLLTHVSYQRIGEPEDIGRVAVMLAGEVSDYIMGASIFVDGGMTPYPEFSTGG